MNQDNFEELYESIMDLMDEYDITVNDALGLLETLKFDILEASKPSPKPTLRSVQ
jgi:hypothetical protein